MPSGDVRETQGFIDGHGIGGSRRGRRGDESLHGRTTDETIVGSRVHGHTAPANPRINGRHTNAQGLRGFPHTLQVVGC